MNIEYMSWSEVGIYLLAVIAIGAGIFGGIWIFLDDLANQMDDGDY